MLDSLCELSRSPPPRSSCSRDQPLRWLQRCFNLYDSGLLEGVATLAIVNTAIITLALVVAQQVGTIGSFQPGRHGSVAGGG